MQNTGEAGTPQTALVMAYIINGSNGLTTSGGLNEITANEIISLTTVAFFPLAADLPTQAGDILLI